MAAIGATVGLVAGGIQTFTWPTVTEADTCTEITLDRRLHSYAIQVTGTFGGATVALHGSLDGTNFAALKDNAGLTIGISAAAISSGGVLAKKLKPVISGGSSQSVTITLVAAFE